VIDLALEKNFLEDLSIRFKMMINYKKFVTSLLITSLIKSLLEESELIKKNYLHQNKI